MLNHSRVRLRFTLMVLVANFVASGSLWATAKAPEPQNDPILNYELYQLDNGLTVILLPDRDMPLAVVDVWYHVGSFDETAGKSGFAHLFEHMLFQGSKNVGEDRHFEILKNIGASQVNGTTSTDRTNYFEQVPANELETALWLESDRMGFLLPLVTEKSLHNQIDVVRNERRQRVDNAPYGPTRMKLNELLYPADHPNHYSVIGKHEDIENAKLDDVISFYKKWYTPANATLVLAGDFETGPVKDLVKKWFGDLKGASMPSRQTLKMPVINKTRTEITEKLVRQRMLTYAWHTPATLSNEDADCDLLASILGSEGTGRLYKRLVLQEKLATEVSISQRSQLYSSTFVIQVLLNPDADLAKVESVIAEELEHIKKEEVTTQELLRAVKKYESQFIWGLESLMSRAETLQSYNLYWGLGQKNPISRDLQRYRQATGHRLQEAAKQYLNERRVEIITLPAPNS